MILENTDWATVRQTRYHQRKRERVINKHLDDLEARIDPEVEGALHDDWARFTEGKFRGDYFAPGRKRKAPARIEWPRVSINDTLDDFDLMALHQFRVASDSLANGDGALMWVRCNYGIGILPSVFGAEIIAMDRGMDTLPTARPVPGGKDAIRKCIKNGIPNLGTGLGAKVFGMGRRFMEVTGPYPLVRKYVHVIHPDLQGVMDVCEVVWGSGLFLDIVDEPGLVRDFLQLITDTYILFMREWERVVPPSEGHACHWGLMHGGRIMLRQDSAMNFSPEMYDEFIAPYDRQLLDNLGGGAMHFCGRGDHYVRNLGSMRNLHAVNMSQPELNNMEAIFRNTVDKGIKLIGLGRPAVEEALRRGRDLHNCVQSGFAS